MRNLFKYQGTVDSYRFEDNGCKARMDLVLYDISDYEKAPTRIEAFGGLANYLNAIEGTDAEERYFKADWYYDSNLYLYCYFSRKKEGEGKRETEINKGK